MHPSLIAVLIATSAVSPKGAIATAHPLASEAGAAALRAGGNAIDAAVAAAFAISVVEPASSGLGGGGFALVYVAKEKKTYAIDFREVGPGKATPTMYMLDGKPQPKLSLDGALSVAVPGAVKGYVELAKRFGKLSLAKLTRDAGEIAARGFPISEHLAWASQMRLECLEKNPDATRIFTAPDEKNPGKRRALQPGEMLFQPDLAKTIRAITAHGSKAFYAGPIAQRLVDSVDAAGGILSLEDLTKYQVRERSPISGSYRGNTIVSFPGPSSGGVIVIGLLNALEAEEPRAGGYRPEHFLHVMIEAEKRLYAMREEMGDPGFAPKMAALTAQMTSKRFAKQVRAQITEKASPTAAVKPITESPDTTHISVIDAEGNAVALTTTVNYVFGSCLVAKGTGVVMNDEMDDFSIAPGVPNAYGVRGGEANAPGPGKTPLSSMAPTLVFGADGKLKLAIGSPGGSTIPTTVAQAIVHFLDDKMPIDRAIAAPRIHEQLFPEFVRIESDGIDAETQRALEARGHVIKFTEPWGNANAVAIDPETGYRVGAADPRADGAAAVP
jgi:gamma-glutamyltranspeptidase/glutathione hydrolase